MKLYFNFVIAFVLQVVLSGEAVCSVHQPSAQRLAGSYPVKLTADASSKLVTKVFENVSFNVNVQNMSDTLIYNYEWECYVEHRLVAHNAVSSRINVGKKQDVRVVFSAPSKPKETTARFVITKINGTPCGEDSIQISIPLVVVRRYFSRKIVTEEATGTWCPWCVRGYVGMKEMADKYPLNFIGIGVHVSDEMGGAENYRPVFNVLNTYPSCMFNRMPQTKAEASSASIERAINADKSMGIAKITAKMYATDADTSTVTVETETKFAFDTNSEYRIAYAIVENNVGPYYQNNGYAGGQNGEMGGFEKQDKYVSLLYDDVARGIYDYNGVCGSVPTQITCDESYYHSHTIRLPKTIDHLNNIEVVAMLMDTYSGAIINADRCGFCDIPECITTQSETLRPVAYYRLDGTLATTRSKGLNILRMSDGSLRKIFVK